MIDTLSIFLALFQCNTYFYTVQRESSSGPGPKTGATDKIGREVGKILGWAEGGQQNAA